MSKLSDAIEARQTGFVKTHPMGFGIEVEQSLIDHRLELLKEYKLGVTLQMRGYAMDEAELHYLKESCKRSIIQEVFGEFRPMLMELERAILNYDMEKARLTVGLIHNEMFSS